MRKAIILIGLLSIILLLGLACGKGSELVATDFNGSDPIVKEFRIGPYSISSGGTFNIPFENVDTFTFVLNGAVDPISFEQFLDVKITATNIDSGSTVIFTSTHMKENGVFEISPSQRTVEYRMQHTMEQLWVGGTPSTFITPGDRIEVTVDYVVGKDVFGDWFAFQMDKFWLVYAESAHH